MSAPDPDPEPRRRRAVLLRLGARIAGLALLAFVLVTQVHWSDELVTRDGTVLRGTVREEAAGWRCAPDGGGDARLVGREETRVRTYGGRDIPAVTYGFRTLAGRLEGSLGLVALMLATRWLTLLLFAGRWGLLVRALRLPFRAADVLRVSLYGAFFNQVAPGSIGGDAVKAWYAARWTGAATKSVMTVFVDRMFGLLALVVFAAGFLYLSPAREGYGPPRTLVAVVCVCAGVLSALLLSPGLRRRLGLSAILRRLPFEGVRREADRALTAYRHEGPTLVACGLLSLAVHAGNGLGVWLLARALALPEVRLGDAMALTSVVGLLTAVPLLPGGWGVGELAFAYFFGQVGVDPSEAVGLSVVYRLATAVASLPGGVLWAFSRDHVAPDAMAAEVAGYRVGKGEGRTP